MKSFKKSLTAVLFAIVLLMTACGKISSTEEVGQVKDSNDEITESSGAKDSEEERNNSYERSKRYVKYFIY